MIAATIKVINMIFTIILIIDIAVSLQRSLNILCRHVFVYFLWLNEASKNHCRSFIDVRPYTPESMQWMENSSLHKALNKVITQEPVFRKLWYLWPNPCGWKIFQFLYSQYENNSNQYQMLIASRDSIFKCK